ncbi:hypothetical protein ACFQFC_23550 [Amorphoplanes digitatis]|uniref:Uncharacterized protein n=1 Tax=Actinoplanes digitatis TaxID=1868 RepID=A0A7W7MUX3_9ACTN|nr:hypothetical protein [Actinoplanes digitatis]MBB4767195.1 hypothetical protein [Actinoplanes digitatis]BFE66830.1 hypothetical protein GCM10020092_001310 [Actinoplanes digitatis]GID95217.1 hypothetical protein Adi01nite_46290 [Actinoplanes digitatis]
MIRDNLGWLTAAALEAVFYPLNQWLVRRKGLDHRPYFVPSLWGLVGTLIIVMAEPMGWRPANRSAIQPGVAPAALSPDSPGR